MSTEIEHVSDDFTAPVGMDLASAFGEGAAFYSTLTVDSFDDRINVVSAMTSAENLADHLGEVINLTNWVCHPVSIESDDGMDEAIRTVLIDDKGDCYACVAGGILRALQNLAGIAGHPSTWEHPVAVTAVEERTRRGFKVLTLRFA